MKMSSDKSSTNIKKRTQSLVSNARIQSLKTQDSNRTSLPNINDKELPKLKSCLKSESSVSRSPSKSPSKRVSSTDQQTKPDSDESILPPSLRSEERDSLGASLSIRFSQMVNLREYDGESAPETVRKTGHPAIYRPVNFRLDERNMVIQADSAKIKKVQLESFGLSRHHMNGCIRAKSMSLDQQCYIRVTTDNWMTFQETEAIDTGDDSSPMLTKYHFDFIIPIPRHEKEGGDLNKSDSSIQYQSANSSITSLTHSPKVTTPTNSSRNLTNKTSNTISHQTSSTSTFSISDCPSNMEFFVVLKSLGMLYIDDNDKQKYKLRLITPRSSVVPVISLTSKSSNGSK